MSNCIFNHTNRAKGNSNGVTAASYKIFRELLRNFSHTAETSSFSDRQVQESPSRFVFFTLVAPAGVVNAHLLPVHRRVGKKKKKKTTLDPSHLFSTFLRFPVNE